MAYNIQFITPSPSPSTLLCHSPAEPDYSADTLFPNPDAKLHKARGKAIHIQEAPSTESLVCAVKEKLSESNNSQPQDKGRAALTVLLGALVFDSFLLGNSQGAAILVEKYQTNDHLGFPLAFGIFQDFYQQNHFFDSTGNSSLIGLLSTGIPFLAAP